MPQPRCSIRHVLSFAVVIGLGAALAPALPALAVTTPTHVDLPLSSLADGIAFDDGHLLTNVVSGTGHALRTDVVTNPVPGQVTLGASSSYTNTPASSAEQRHFATSAGVDVVTDETTGTVVVRRGATVLTTIPQPLVATWSVDLSGPFLRVGRNLYDLRKPAGVAFTVPSTTVQSALYGSRLAWAQEDGHVYYKDLASSAAALLVNPGATGCTACGTQVAINGGTLAFGRVGGWLALWDIAARTSVPHALALSASARRIWLGDGFLLINSPTGVDGYRLNDPSSLSVGSTVLADDVVDLAIDGHALAYVRASGTATVTQLPDGVDGPQYPLLMPASVTAAFSPNGDTVADAWNPSLTFTQPLTSWSLTIVAPTGATVATFTPALGSMPSANVSPSWTGGGRPPGTYSWSLTAAGVDGDAMRLDGSTVGGKVTLRLANTQRSVVKTPANVAVTHTGAKTPVSWNLPAFPTGVTAASYDLQRRTVSINAKGKRSYSKVLGIVSRTPGRSGVVGATQGRTYQFRVRNRDTVGLLGPWSGWTTSNTPFDDRAGVLRYGKGWKAQKNAAYWYGSVHVASSSGRTVTLAKTRASGFALVMTKCAACGSVKVFVDGKQVKTVNLYAVKRASRVQVCSIGFKKFGGHSLKLVTVKNGKRGTVDLDAVLVRH